MYRAIDVAKWFIIKGISEKKPLTPMQVLKLVYIAQGSHLAMYNEMLYSESCEAWRYGPVVPAVYQRTKDFGKKSIKLDPFEKQKGINPEDKETISLLSNVWETFGKLSGFELSTWTHRGGSAWDIAYNQENGKNYIGYDIAADLLKNEFSKLIENPGQQRQSPPGW